MNVMNQTNKQPNIYLSKLDVWSLGLRSLESKIDFCGEGINSSYGDLHIIGPLTTFFANL